MVESTQSINARQQTEKQDGFLQKFQSVLGPDGIRRSAFCFAIGAYYNLREHSKAKPYTDLTESAIREISILEPFFKSTGFGVNVFWHPSPKLLQGIIVALSKMENKELHLVKIYYTGHGVMKDGGTCMVIPHPKPESEEDEKRPWDDRDNIFELQFWIHNELGGKKNLKVVAYYDCCRKTYVAKTKGDDELVPMVGFAGNIYSYFGCMEN